MEQISALLTGVPDAYVCTRGCGMGRRRRLDTRCAQAAAHRFCLPALYKPDCITSVHQQADDKRRRDGGPTELAGKVFSRQRRRRGALTACGRDRRCGWRRVKSQGWAAGGEDENKKFYEALR